MCNPALPCRPGTPLSARRTSTATSLPGNRTPSGLRSQPRARQLDAEHPLEASQRVQKPHHPKSRTSTSGADTESAARQSGRVSSNLAPTSSRDGGPPSCRLAAGNQVHHMFGVLYPFKVALSPGTPLCPTTGTGFSAPSGQTEDRGDSPTSLARDERFDNDPPAGSPTGTLLRLLFPLNNQVRASFRHVGSTRKPNRQPIRSPH